MGGQGRKPIIPHVSPKRYRECQGLPSVGEVALRSNDGEGKPGRKEPLRSDGQALCQSDTIAVQELFGSGLALSVSLRSTRPGCGSQHPPRSACVLLAAAPTAPPCFRHWRRSSPLPLVGEPLAKPFTLRGLPRPPLGRGGGTASAVTERLSSSPKGRAFA